MYIMAYHQLDVTQAQLRGLLNLALPRQVAERFVIDPTAYSQKSRMPATIMFMDFVGFTQTCEELAHDPDPLSAHLEAAMDRLVGELVKHDLIIDKFIGDAVMSFRGGPLVGGRPGRARLPRRAGGARQHQGAGGAGRPLLPPGEDRRRLGGRLPDRRLRHQRPALVHDPRRRREPRRPARTGQRASAGRRTSSARRPTGSAPSTPTWSGAAGAGSGSSASPSPVTVYEAFDAAELRRSARSSPPSTAPSKPSSGTTSTAPATSSCWPTRNARGATSRAATTRTGASTSSSAARPSAGSPSSRRTNDQTLRQEAQERRRDSKLRNLSSEPCG